jgi:beta-lactamase class A
MQEMRISDTFAWRAGETSRMERLGALRVGVLLGLMLLGPASRGEDPPAQSALGGVIMPLVEKHKGKVAVAVKHLGTGESFRHQADVPMPTASLIKFPVMIEAYRQSEAGTIDLKKTITLREEDKVPGSGVLTDHFSPGASFPVIDTVHLMITFSDNTATNLVLDQIGIGSTAELMDKLGCPNTRIHSKVYRRDTSVFPERSKQFGLGSTTADEMIRLFEELHHERLVSPAASQAMIAHLKTCDDKDKFPRFLPPGTPIAFKTGSVNAARTAAGIIYAKNGPIALCVLTDENEDQSWVPDNAGDRLCAEIARVVHAHFQQPGATPPATAP